MGTCALPDFARRDANPPTGRQHCAFHPLIGAGSRDTGLRPHGEEQGLRERKVVQNHVLRTSLLPVTTVIGLRAGQLLGSIVIVETIFTWPGLSSLMFQGINNHDYPVVQGCVIVTAMLFLLINLFVDVLNGVIDPRVSVGAGS